MNAIAENTPQIIYWHRDDLKLLSTIRRLAPRAAVIMMTAYGTPEVATAALDLGAYRVVSKPIEVSEARFQQRPAPGSL
jgi:DNA-binding NtrC family response regulator